MDIQCRALVESLLKSPLLVGDLMEAPRMDRARLGLPCAATEFNFSQKLGHLYEDVLASLIDASDCLERVASHLQVVNDAGVTLGEMDYVLHDKLAGKYVQLELAVKFYLAVETPEGWIYPGPDPRDTWQSKLARLRSHQLRLTELPETGRLLHQRFGIEAIEVRQLIYGCLFSPLSGPRCPPPEAIVADARCGRWLYISEWPELMHGVAEVHVVPKPLWPVALTDAVKASLTLSSVAELMACASERCTMFVLPDSEEPLFLVPDTWRQESRR